MITQSCSTPVSKNLLDFVDMISQTNDFDSFEVVRLTSSNVENYQKFIKQSFTYRETNMSCNKSDLNRMVVEDYEELLTLLPVSMILFKQKYSSVSRYFSAFFEEEDSILSFQPISLSLVKGDAREIMINLHGNYCSPFASKMIYDSSISDDIFHSLTFLLPFNKIDCVIDRFYNSKPTTKLFEIEVRILHSFKNKLSNLNMPSDIDLANHRRLFDDDKISVINTRFVYENTVILDEYDAFIRAPELIINQYLSMFLSNPVKQHDMTLDIQPAPTKEYCDYYKKANLSKVIEMIKC